LNLKASKIFRAHIDRALAYWSDGKLREAAVSFESALELNPGSADIMLSLGQLHCQLGEPEMALKCLDRLLAKEAYQPDALLDKAAILQSLSRFEESLPCLDRVLARDELNADAWLGKGIACQQLGRSELALQFVDRSIEIKPDNASAWSNRGNILSELGRIGDALESHNRAVSLSDSPILLSNLALVLNKAGKASEASILLDKVLALLPDHADSRVERAHILLTQHDFIDGWHDYEWRWNTAACDSQRLNSDRPVWDGRRFEGRLLVWGEQGIGDQILHSSMLSDLDRLGQDVVVSADPRLLDIFRRRFPRFEFVRNDQPISLSYDAYISMASLGQYFRHSVKNFPLNDREYLIDDESRTRAFREKSPHVERPIIGLSWSSGNARLGKIRSIDLHNLMSALCAKSASFINLQYGDTSAQLSDLDLTIRDRFIDFPEVDRMKDLDGLLSLIQLCDVVVTISNSTAHLAGALGKEVWLLVPYANGRFWYWYPFEERCLWYPSVKIIPQVHAGSWDEPLATIRHQLEALVARK